MANEESKTILLGGIIYISLQVIGIIVLGKIYDISGIAAATVLEASGFN